MILMYRKHMEKAFFTFNIKMLCLGLFVVNGQPGFDPDFSVNNEKYFCRNYFGEFARKNIKL